MVDPGSAEEYEKEIFGKTKELSDLQLISFAARCVRRCMTLFENVQHGGGEIADALRDVENWLGNLPMSKPFEVWDRVLSEFHRQAWDEYNKTDAMNTLEHASPSGRNAYQRANALEAVTFLLSAIHHVESRRDICAEAIASAWIATLYSEEERVWQLGVLSEYVVEE